MLYDWRLSPFDVADALYEYIRQIKSEYNCDKVSLYARCYGANVMSVYLYKYGHEDIDTVVYSASSAMGAVIPSCLFSGNINVDTDALEAYLNDCESLTGDRVTDELIFSTISYLNSVKGLYAPTATINLFLKKLYPIIAPEILRISYGRYASIWAMVSAEDYEQARNLVFDGYEEEYAGLLDKIDRYFKVQQNLPSMLQQYHKEGMKIAIFARYGSALLPLFSSSMQQNDDTILTEKASFGAVCADSGETFTVGQMKNFDSEYISPDQVIYTKNCLFPEQTWFIKDIGHDLYTDDFFDFLSLINNSKEEITIHSENALPEFLQYNDETGLLSAVEEATPIRKTMFTSVKNFFAKMFRLFRSVFAFLKK